jgi:proteasome lid subunit RPN8/RPN11
MDDADEVPFVIYHSHTATEAHPARTDIPWRRADAHYCWCRRASRSRGGPVVPHRRRAVTEEEVRHV